MMTGDEIVSEGMPGPDRADILITTLTPGSGAVVMGIHGERARMGGCLDALSNRS